MSIAVEIVKQTGEFVKEHSKEIIMASGGVVVTRVVTKINDNKILLKEKEKSYKKGVEDGVKITEDYFDNSLINPLLAQIAVAYYIARSDGNISNKEQEIIDKETGNIMKIALPKVVVNEIKFIVENKKISFDQVSNYLDCVDTKEVESLLDYAQEIAIANNKISKSEEYALNKIVEYLDNRYNATNKKVNYEKKDIKYIDQQVIDDAVIKYTWRMRMLDRTFEKKTSLSKKEISLLMIATCLQCLRIHTINRFTEIEKANHGNREKFLHEKQEKFLSKLKSSENEKASQYYAPLNQIVLTHGVPYDATRYKYKNIKLFKGANHRFSTLGHDPLLGLVVGTANIMTNTITAIGYEDKLPRTYHVEYDNNYKNAVISKEADSFKMLEEVIKRIDDDITSFVAALLKEIIHIATDIYTPAGIQLPGASLVMSKQNVEMLTKYISAGDVVKFNLSSKIEHMIDTLIRVIHGCLVMENGDELNSKINLVKANKIVDYSKAISSGSNIIEKMITNKYHEIDFPGLINLVIGSFKDLDFLYDVKYEFISNGLEE